MCCAVWLGTNESTTGLTQVQRWQAAHVQFWHVPIRCVQWGGVKPPCSVV